MSAPSPRERAQHLFDKNLELEKRRRRSAQAQVPSDPNIWPQLRENFEAIILEDHAFSEQHNIEYNLWVLHYKRIEELRAHFNAAISSANSKSPQGGKGSVRPERITKIRQQLKTFLSEATGFYHDLIMKIKAKNGLPLGYFEDSENLIVMEKDGKKSAEMKKSLLSCHRCLIYLGDLARYKGLYGEGDSKKREFAAASSYYLQAASIWPLSGNPHHQLALLASYSGDELAVIYRYFRSLAVDSPFTTARDNLIVAFEKNRQSYSQLSGDVKAIAVKESSGQLDGKGRGKIEAKLVTRGNGVDAYPRKEGASNIQETYKSFCTRFVRLNGILFTRTSLETFTEVLSLISTGLRELLSSGQDEELNFGQDALENGLAIVRIISIIVFTVHNAKKESEGQTYAEIVQRAVLLQNAFTAAFELMSIIIERCVQLQDPSCSFLLPGILVFVEWLACYPDLAAGNDVDENQSTVRSKFWNNCISFLNKLLSVGPMSIGDEEETCFSNMSRYEEGETDNRLALWEDFELRGFVPLIPAQTILDFSRKHSFGSDREKERKARVKRILAAGKALSNIVRTDQKRIYFDSKGKKFIIGVEHSISDDFVLATSKPIVEDLVKKSEADKPKSGIVQSDHQQYPEGEDDDDEVIVFKPIVAEKRADVVVVSSGVTHKGLEPVPVASGVDVKFNVNSTFNSPNHVDLQASLPASVSRMMPQSFQPVQQHSSRWLEGGVSLANSFEGLGFSENGHVVKSELPLHEAVSSFNHASLSVPFQQSVSTGTNSFYGLSKAEDFMIPSKVDNVASAGVTMDNSSGKSLSVSQADMKKSPVSRPSRHRGPPPGFSHVSPRLDMESTVSDSISGNPVMDDYSWLDGYQLPASTKVCFPFPGKQVPSALQGVKQNGWQDYHTTELLSAHHHQPQQPITNGNQHFTPLPEQYQGQSIWTGRYFV
ncbi:unnamed protein product [Vicia faba]|uniref:Protein SMG7 n=1 Tax=Vicia faba TaxID=3906 RepID=A0AAV0YKX1_VICFA|nr:unnamed protein product [Vicia faba]